jgi:N-acetylneuraminate synthase
MGVPTIIAEIGVNFYDTAKKLTIAPLDAAKMYIREAKKAGADIVKFQSYKAETLVSKKSPAYWDTKQEPTKTQFELFKKHDKFNKNDFEIVGDYCKEQKIGFMSTPFDDYSVDYLSGLLDIYKISSSDITNIPFLKHIASKKKPIYLSTGASYISEIDTAVRAIKDAGCKEISLFHCILCYPTKNEDANLNMICHLKKIYPNLKIGYSDHTMPDKTMTILSTAFLLGAEIIEKHFTLDKTLPGNDHYHGMDPEDLKTVVENFKLIGKIRGRFEKTVIPGEFVPRREARRSIVINKPLKKGSGISREDISIKRPGYGVSPGHIDMVIGRKVNRDIEEDTVLMWDMV